MGWEVYGSNLSETRPSFILSTFIHFSPDDYHSSFFFFLWQPVGLGKIAKLINAGKIDSSELITMKTLKVCQPFIS